MDELKTPAEAYSQSTSNRLFLKLLIGLFLLTLFCITGLVASIWLKHRQQMAFIERNPVQVRAREHDHPRLRSVMGAVWMRGFDPIYYISGKGPQIDDDFLRDLNDYPEVETLWLSRATITDDGLEQLRELKKLRDLRISSSDISGAGLGPLIQSANLKNLYLASPITDEGLKQIGLCVSLEQLSLTNTEVTDQGLTHLKGLTDLKELSLSDTDITDEGLHHLRNLASLERLALDGTQITDPGLQLLREMPHLQYLRLSKEQITEQDLQELELAFPHCAIDRW